MDVWLDDGGRSDLYSDEGTVFGHMGLGDWEQASDALRAWLVRDN